MKMGWSFNRDNKLRGIGYKWLQGRYVTMFIVSLRRICVVLDEYTFAFALRKRIMALLFDNLTFRLGQAEHGLLQLQRLIG